mmetsp:Transcript_104586/g.312382  ORF Transcript_104586/g.312382 Transcript_104586/m.312382 type:complete len:205 (-) Transcript_104586:738-1352(-)
MLKTKLEMFRTSSLSTFTSSSFRTFMATAEPICLANSWSIFTARSSSSSVHLLSACSNSAEFSWRIWPWCWYIWLLPWAPLSRVLAMVIAKPDTFLMSPDSFLACSSLSSWIPAAAPSLLCTSFSMTFAWSSRSEWISSSWLSNSKVRSASAACSSSVICWGSESIFERRFATMPLMNADLFRTSPASARDSRALRASAVEPRW